MRSKFTEDLESGDVMATELLLINSFIIFLVILSGVLD